jgi:two-component system, OmpR family, phosphate regulon sensor histidine kinase PhoR
MVNFEEKMKLNRTYLFIIVSSIALIAVLAIQVNWIFQSAKVKAELFNEKASMVLSRTAEALCEDKETCMTMGNCCVTDDSSECKLELGKNELNKIDSLLENYMKFYNFHIDYSFEVIKPKQNNILYQDNWNGNVFKKRLEEVANKNGLELKLIFPEKKQFIIEEMGSMFITSVILILVVLFMFWRTILSLIKEKKISEHTTDFLNNMTHEFKTPLTNIALAGKMIIKDTNIRQEDKIKHYTSIILDENEKLRLQVEQVLSMTALERGEIPLLRSEIDFHTLINNSLKCIGIQIENKKGNLIVDLKAVHFKIIGDKNHLTNAICNLIDNAVKYSGENPEISIRTYNSNNKIITVISDNGIGIDKEYMKQVFDKYFRVPTGDIHDVKGFGLGLAYVKTIIEMHKGTIDLKSEKRKGSTFTITLPLKDE